MNTLLQRITGISLLLLLAWTGAASAVQPRLWKSSVSLKHRAPGSLAKPATGTAVIRNLHVLAIRVEFQADDFVTTTGNGKFILTDSATTYDPPPHNRSYFVDHMEGLARYYRSVSRGVLNVTYDVYPAGETDAYQLPEKMNVYNPDGTDTELDSGLAQLTADAVAAADADPAIQFGAYDALVIFHAGVGLDYVITEGFEPTPNDIPSVFLNLDDLRSTIGGGNTGYNGIPVDGGASFIQEAVIVPETSSKQDYDVALNGILYHQFGHVLGLPSLFNTANGRPAVGMFSLMDVGFANENASVPAEPCAWSKLYLGWEQAVEVAAGENIPVFCSQAGDVRKIYRIPISSTEYFLIENRQQDFAGDSLIGTAGNSGAIIAVDDYDGGLPGSGLLIWHIDERVIEAHLPTNTVNADIKRRGVDLEEADGSEDIGKLFEGALPGFLLPDNGIAADMFSGTKLDENTPLLDKFTPETVPNTLSNDRAVTNISMTGITPIDTVMRFNLNIGRRLAGWPQYTGDAAGGLSPQIVDIDNNGAPDVVAATPAGKFLIWPGLNPGNSVWAAPVTVSPHGEEVRTYSLADRFFTGLTGGIPSVPVLGLLSGKHYWTMLDTDNNLHAYRLEGTQVTNVSQQQAAQQVTSNLLQIRNVTVFGDGDGYVQAYDTNGLLWREQAGLNPVEFLVKVGHPDSADVLAVGPGLVARLHNGTRLWQQSILDNPVGAIVADFDRNGVEECVIIQQDAVYHEGLPKSANSPLLPIVRFTTMGLNGVVMSGNQPQAALETFTSAPVAADINGDGYLNIVVRGLTKLYVLNYNGTLAEEFPIQVEESEELTLLAAPQPIVADLDNDGRLDILTGTQDGLLKAYDRFGAMLAGFPIAVGGAVQATPALGDIDANGTLDLVVASEDRFIYAWDLEVPATADVSWGTYGHDLQHTFRQTDTAPAPVPSGNELLVKKSVYNYPNPTRGGHTTLHYVVNAQSTVRVRIYNLAGELVEELESQGAPLVDNEIVWNIGGVASGVYMARVEAEGDGRKEHEFCTIAVIK